MRKIGLNFGKKGFYDIEDFIAVLVYTLILFLLLVIISLPMCSNKRNVDLEASGDKIDSVNSEQLVLEMLRTPLPKNLPQLIDSHRGKKFLVKVTVQPGLAEAAQTPYKAEEMVDVYDGVDIEEAIKLLNSPEYYGIYRERTYGESIDRLQFMVADEKERNNLFAVVTRAVFISPAYQPHLTDARPDLIGLYAYPEAYVKYGSSGKFSESNADLTNPTPETKEISPGFGTVTFRKSKLGEAYSIIPLTDISNSPATASVMLVVRQSNK